MMKKPCIINGIGFQSQAEAARYFGVTPSRISQVIKFDGAVGKGSARKETEIGGASYESRRAAADALGVSFTDVIAYMRVCRAIEAMKK